MFARPRQQRYQNVSRKLESFREVKTKFPISPPASRLDPTQKEHLIEIIVHMLSDKSTVVLGSVISSFNQVCHDRFDLIHPHFRKLCRLLVDTDEWGQIEIAGLLLRYVRANFKNPAKVRSWPQFDLTRVSFESSPSSKKTGDSPLDSDLRLLLDCCKTTLYSRNRSVCHLLSSRFNGCTNRLRLVNLGCLICCQSLYRGCSKVWMVTSNQGAHPNTKHILQRSPGHYSLKRIDCSSHLPSGPRSFCTVFYSIYERTKVHIWFEARNSRDNCGC